MRPMPLIALIAFAALLAGATTADTQQNCQAAWSGMPDNAKGKTSREAFLGECQKSQTTAGATVLPPPPDATAKCSDGSYSMSSSPVDACAGHGGKGPNNR